MPTELLLVLAAAALFAATMWALARMGGWRELAERYPGIPAAEMYAERWGWWQRPRAGQCRRRWWGITSIRLRWFAGYNGCILWRADDEYLHLRVVPPFNIFHPPMSIPWAEMDVVRVASWYVRLRIADVPVLVARRVARPLLDDRSAAGAAAGVDGDSAAGSVIHGRP